MKIIEDCSVEGCGRLTGIPGTARGYCSGHYHRWQRYGDPLQGGALRDHDPISRLARRIDFNGPGGCWVWIGAMFNTGYGNVDGITTSHRFMWETMVGPIADGLVIDHLCSNRACCNPDHLEPVTQRVNLLRANVLRRLRAAA